jgi:FtsP/CotA-like multicopper oxidase with cupredoxin domain
LPNADGVPGLTQPIKPGASFTYGFTPPDAGTFWYHSHANSLEQLGRGLAGAFIVEEREPVAIDRDLVWMLADWRLNPDGQLSRRFGNALDDAMSGHVGNVVTLNGSAVGDQPVKAGERLRLRLVNSALARMMALRFEGHKPTIVAIDGQPCEPHEPEGGSLPLGPGMRLDVVIDMQGDPGRSYAIVDEFYDDLAYALTHLAYDQSGACPRASSPCAAGTAAQSLARTRPRQRRTPRHRPARRNDERRHDDGHGRHERHGDAWDGRRRSLGDQWHVHDRGRPSGYAAHGHF